MSRFKLVSFACSDNADDEPWHQHRATELMEEYNDWFEATEFIYDKDYRYIQAYSKTKKDYIPTKFYVYADIVNPELQVLFKLKWA